MGRSRYGILAGLALLVALIAAGLWGYGKAAPYAQIGGAYIAKQYCSCLFVTGRSETSCRAEFEPDIDKFSVRTDRSGLPARAKVTARIAIFAAEATYADGYGCTLSK